MVGRLYDHMKYFIRKSQPEIQPLTKYLYFKNLSRIMNKH